MANKRITDVDYIDSLNSNESFFVNQNNTIKQINKGDVVFPIVNGGTGATTADTARTNLGLGLVAVENKVPISKGGTGAVNATDALSNLGGYPKSGGEIGGEIVLPNGKSLCGKNASGEQCNLITMSAQNNLLLGYDLPEESKIRVYNPIVFDSSLYGATLPTTAVTGQIFFLKM